MERYPNCSPTGRGRVKSSRSPTHSRKHTHTYTHTHTIFQSDSPIGRLVKLRTAVCIGRLVKRIVPPPLSRRHVKEIPGGKETVDSGIEFSFSGSSRATLSDRVTTGSDFSRFNTRAKGQASGERRRPIYVPVDEWDAGANE